MAEPSHTACVGHDDAMHATAPDVKAGLIAGPLLHDLDRCSRSMAALTELRRSLLAAKPSLERADASP